tara:strand:- start:16059 stop:16892 length:834 start_codon:yes stop_codon:yes gene_type:complete
MITIKYFIAFILSFFSKFNLFKKTNFSIQLFHEIDLIDRKKVESLLSKNKSLYLNPLDLDLIFNNSLNLKKDHLLLTFDDGFYSNYQIAKKILNPLGIKAIFFVSTNFINCDSQNEEKLFIENNFFSGSLPKNLNISKMKSMSWENIIDLVNDGHSIGSHTKNHLKLSKIKNIKILEEEILHSAKEIEQKTGFKVKHFAYPFGDIDSINRKVINMIKTRYKFLFSGLRGKNYLTTNPYALKRNAINPCDKLWYNNFLSFGGWSFYYLNRYERFKKMF